MGLDPSIIAELMESNAQYLWISSRRARGGRTFPNDPVMVTE
jgi:hypothetical protein